MNKRGLGVITGLIGTWLACAAWPTSAQAYATWTGGCSSCHGDFYLEPYSSLSDATSWAGNSLMFGHLGFMGNDACNVCHQPPAGTPRFPVYIGRSAGITGYSPIGCLGCHGRPGDATGVCVTGNTTTINPANCGMGRGLRRHHANAGITACASCHTDGTTVAGESVRPTFYFTPDTVHPSKPTDACNAAPAPRNENKFGLSGLDNDGDGLYDSADSDCVDSDSDGIRNGSDNCRLTSNANQLDANLDGFGNACDGDLNNSGTTTATDFNLLRACLNLSAGSSATCAAADMNGSGIVTATDFNLLRARINQAPGPSGLFCADSTAPFTPCPSQ